MVELKELQKQVYDNKVAHGFNVTRVDTEFCLIMTELGEAFRAYGLESKEAFAEELADVAVYLLGLAEITGVDLEREILKKMEKNKSRKYRKLPNGFSVKVE
ncbi:MAG: MazG-like family protein [Christensenellales bacterium]|jgi:NTP pyrophosphatase (non-canonical NTP hydrolase)